VRLGIVLAGAFFSVGMLGSQALADNFPFVGNQLYDWCRMADTVQDENVKIVSQGLCAGYIGGVADTLSIAKSGCLEKGTRLEQLIDLVKLYLSNHPESRHYPATKADADVANVLTMDEARRIASKIAKLPNFLAEGGLNAGQIHEGSFDGYSGIVGLDSIRTYRAIGPRRPPLRVTCFDNRNQ
jgi:hypothetical protein